MSIKVGWLAVVLIVLDQATKLLARTFLAGSRFEILGGLFGLTYAENPGFWLDTGLAHKYITLMQLFTLLGLVLVAGFWAIYRRYYRDSRWMGFALACLLASAAGNMFLDRFIYGYVIDFLIVPFWVANLSDIYSNLFLICFVTELIVYPPGRQVLRWTPPGEWRRETRFFYRFSRRCLLRWLAGLRRTSPHKLA